MIQRENTVFRVAYENDPIQDVDYANQNNETHLS